MTCGRMTFGSLFAGIGGLDLGIEQAGLACKWQVETDRYCLKVLERHWPDVQRYGDVRGCGRHNLEPVDLVCGGFPCQDVSVAGRRKGLAGDRSGLWFEFHRILAELTPRWVVIENVPGLLSSNQGRDFAFILRGLAELGYLSAWRILDAQYFGVAQRRRRVFIVGHLRDGRAAQVLFEPTCGPRDTPPSREAGARVASYIVGGFREYCEGLPGLRVGGRHDSQGLLAWHENKSGELTPSDHTKALRSGASHSYQGVAYNIQQNDGGEHRRKDRPEGGMYVRETDMALTVGTTDRTVVLGFDRTRGTASGEIAAPLRCNSAQSPGVNDGKADNQCVAWEMAHASEVVRMSGDIAPTLQKRMGTGGNEVPLVGVRRLTPVECERLQGFPDNFTAGQSDSKRYRQLGNAVCVPVAEWIGRRILDAEAR